MGAKEYEPIINRGADFITASVVDPFGNIDMQNVAYHYLDLVPKGRDEAGHEFRQFWVRRHDEYDKSSFVTWLDPSVYQ